MAEPTDVGSGAPDHSWSAGFNSVQLANARLIVNIGQQMGMSTRDIRIALQVAMQESSLINNSGGDRDSAGLFQQRPSMGWGTYAQVTDPEYATRKFYNTLKGVAGRDDMAAWEAGQAVQRSADGTLYKRWHDEAVRLADKFGGGSSGNTGGSNGIGGGGGDVSDYINDIESLVNPITDYLGDLSEQQSEIKSLADQMEENAEAAATGSSPVPIGVAAADAPMEFSDLALQQGPDPEMMESIQDLQDALDNAPDIGKNDIKDAINGGGNAAPGKVGKVIDLARSFLGDPYVWGGESPGGFDCSGLMQYIFNKIGVNLPRTAAEQGQLGKRRGLKNLQPGDMIFWDWGSSGHRAGADHVALYIGNGQIIEAPRPGESVQISNIYHADQAWSVRLF